MAEANVFSIFIGIVIFVSFFAGMFAYYTQMVYDNGNFVTIDARYNALNSSLSSYQQDLRNRTDQVRNITANVGEGTDETIMAGFTGFAKGISLLVETVSVGTGVVTTVAQTTNIVPDWFSSMIILLLVIIIVFALFKIIVRSPGTI